eukprot:TRINITY_DN1693_c0_g1_i12.p1 TRINITY_DN1693_c0_g1~~TRINITY_DN1693_c0_g1_i12.p1  ORF type:complete len:111 (-),score=4.28 TRINITY_DN1693_c0_g1_i12:52-384(-)
MGSFLKCVCCVLWECYCSLPLCSRYLILLLLLSSGSGRDRGSSVVGILTEVTKVREAAVEVGPDGGEVDVLDLFGLKHLTDDGGDLGVVRVVNTREEMVLDLVVEARTLR